MESVVANLAGKIRYETLNGRQYLVAPLTLIVPGVLAGSQGALYYPPDEIARNHQAWDRIPLTAYHPISIDGRHLSANDEGVLERQGIGHVVSPYIDSQGKLKAEGWFDIERTNKVHSGILDSLRSNRPIELSTGLYTDNIPADNDSNFRGRTYTHIARNYRPDHLAVLPDQIGACSIRDGCGVLVNRTNGNAALVLNEATRNAISVAQFFTTLLHAATSAHILHLSTRSFAAHMALDSLYKSLPGLVDDIVEAWQGRNEIVVGWASGYTPPLNDPAAFVKSMCDYVANNRQVIGDYTPIQNLVDTLADELDGTLYKLRFLS